MNSGPIGSVIVSFRILRPFTGRVSLPRYVAVHPSQWIRRFEW